MNVEQHAARTGRPVTISGEAGGERSKRIVQAQTDAAGPGAEHIAAGWRARYWTPLGEWLRGQPGS